MNVRALEEATKIYSDIQKISTDIDCMEAKAVDLADNDRQVHISLAFEKTSKGKQEVQARDTEMEEFEKFLNDSMGSSPLASMFGGATIVKSKSKSQTPKDIISYDIDSTETLYVIDALIKAKKLKRRSMIAELKRLGCDFNETSNSSS